MSGDLFFFIMECLIGKPLLFELSCLVSSPYLVSELVSKGS
jgi:hypothetical protein